jgi:Peptidase family M28
VAERRDWIRGVLIVALLMLGFAIKDVLIAPPQPPSRAAPGEFDTSRALGRLQRTLGDQRPHRVDSEADDAVRERLIAELRAIGLEPQVQEALDCSGLPKARLISCSRIRNVIATIPGQTPGRQLLLDAHYDSTPAGPGAGDDGVGVATLLEVGAILKASPPPRPVTLLFNEGEEFGLNGSSAFVRSGLARQVDSLINIDARGVNGPALMFETSEPNGAAVALYARAAHRPYANSLSTDFARLIPNTTDVVEFRPAGWTLINYGIIGNETRYHTPGDTVEALDRASLYHVGSEVLAMTRAMAATPRPAGAGAGRAVFTDIAGRAFIRMPATVAAIALALLLVAAALLAWREKALTRALGLAAGMTAAGIASSSFVALIATLARPGDFWRAYPLVTYLAIYALLLAAMTAVWARWGRTVEPGRMRPAAWLLIMIVGAAMSLVLPGAMIFFLVAPAIALAGIALQRRLPRTAIFLGVVATAIQFLMFAQLLALVEMLLVDGPVWAVTPVAALAVLPALIEIRDARLRPALMMLLAATLGLWAAALVVPRASAERPASFSIDYFRIADRKEAFWGIAAKQAPLPRGFPGQWHSGVLSYNGRTRWIADAPLLDTPVPTARMIDTQGVGEGRRVRIALSPGGGDAVAIRFDETMKILALGLPGSVEPIPAEGVPSKATLRCSGRSCDGLVIEAVLANRKPLLVEVLSSRFSLPIEGRRLQSARPRNAIPQYWPDTTITRTRMML